MNERHRIGPKGVALAAVRVAHVRLMTRKQQRPHNQNKKPRRPAWKRRYTNLPTQTPESRKAYDPPPSPANTLKILLYGLALLASPRPPPQHPHSPASINKRRPKRKRVHHADQPLKKPKHSKAEAIRTLAGHTDSPEPQGSF